MYSKCSIHSGVRSPEIFAVVAVYFLKLGNKATSFNLDIFYILILLLLLLGAISWIILLKSKNSRYYFSLKDSSILQNDFDFTHRNIEKKNNGSYDDNNRNSDDIILNVKGSNLVLRKKLRNKKKSGKIPHDLLHSIRLNKTIMFSNKSVEESLHEVLLPETEKIYFDDKKYLDMNNGGRGNNEKKAGSDNNNDNLVKNEDYNDDDNDNSNNNNNYIDSNTYIDNENRINNKLKTNLPEKIKSKETIINDYNEYNKINILCVAVFIIMFCSIFQASFFVFVTSSVEGRDIEQILYFDRLFADLLGRPLTRLRRPSFLQVF